MAKSYSIKHNATTVAMFTSDIPVTKGMVRRAAEYLRQQGISYDYSGSNRWEIYFYKKDVEVIEEV